MKKAILALLLPVVLAACATLVVSCATAPPHHAVERQATIQAPYEVLWSALIDVVGDSRLPISSADKASGVVRLGPFRTSGGYADCGGNHETTGRATVLLRDTSRRSCDG